MPSQPIRSLLLPPSTIWHRRALKDWLGAFSPLPTDFSCIHWADVLRLFLRLRGHRVAVLKQLHWSTKAEGFYLNVVALRILSALLSLKYYLPWGFHLCSPRYRSTFRPRA